MIELLGVPRNRNKPRPIMRRVAGWYLGEIHGWGTGVADTQVRGRFAIGSDGRLYTGTLDTERKAFVAQAEWNPDFTQRSGGWFRRGGTLRPFDPVMGHNAVSPGQWQANIARLVELLDSAGS